MNCRFNMFPPTSVIDSHVTIILDDGKDVSFTPKGALQALRILSEFLSRAAEIQGAPAEQTGNNARDAIFPLCACGKEMYYVPALAGDSYYQCECGKTAPVA